MIAAIIQARMTSSRLPGKVMMDIAGQPLLQRMIRRVRKAAEVDQILVATTTNREDNPVATLCKTLGVPVHRGDEYDVLQRFLDAAESVHAKTVIRLTADCPMIDPDVIDDAVRLFQGGQEYDYVSNIIERTYPDGLDVEVFSTSSLRDANREATLPYQREHVTPWLHGLRLDVPAGDYNRGHLVFASDFSHIRWTVDHLEDLERVRNLVAHLPEDFNWLDALSLATKNPALLGLSLVEDK